MRRFLLVILIFLVSQNTFGAKVCTQVLDHQLTALGLGTSSHPTGTKIDFTPSIKKLVELSYAKEKLEELDALADNYREDPAYELEDQRNKPISIVDLRQKWEENLLRVKGENKRDGSDDITLYDLERITKGMDKEIASYLRSKARSERQRSQAELITKVAEYEKLTASLEKKIPKGMISINELLFGAENFIYFTSNNKKSCPHVAYYRSNYPSGEESEIIIKACSGAIHLLFLNGECRISEATIKLEKAPWSREVSIKYCRTLPDAVGVISGDANAMAKHNCDGVPEAQLDKCKDKPFASTTEGFLEAVDFCSRYKDDFADVPSKNAPSTPKAKRRSS